MKIGLVTFYYAHNYGAVLQAYALKKKLQEWNHHCVVVDYQNPAILEHYPKEVDFPIGKKDMALPWRWIKTARAVLYRQYAKKAWKSQWEKFDQFITTDLLEGEKGGIEDFYDACVCGSDQIWGGVKGPTTYLDDMYFLKFSKSAIKIAYAASNYTGLVEESEKVYFQEALKDFRLITVREQSLADSIWQSTGYSVQTALDPTFLLSKEDYLRLLEESTPVEEDYVLAYFLEEDKRVRKIANRLAKNKKIKVIEIHYYLQFDCGINNQRADVGPKEFLSLLNGAAYVVTNSFHGIALSIIFEKQFYAVYIKDSRKSHLLALLGLRSRHIYSSKEMVNQEMIGYEEVRKRVEEQRAKAFGLLEQGLALTKIGE